MTLFNSSSPLSYRLPSIIESTMNHACGAANVEHACMRCALFTSRGMHMRRGTLVNGTYGDTEEKNC